MRLEEKYDRSLSFGPHGLMFHYFHDGLKHKSSQGSISKTQFEKILDYVSLERIIPAQEWAQRAEKGLLKKGDICLTFDDGLRCQYDVALPVLRKYGLTAFWFVNSSTLTGEIGYLEAYRRFRNEYFSSMDAFYEAFFSVAIDSAYEATVSRKLENFPSEYLSEFPFYTKEDRKFRFLRDKVLKPKEYKDVMKILMESKKVNIKDLTKDLWLKTDHLCTMRATGHIIGIHSHSHPTAMADLSYKEQQVEYQKNFKILSNILQEEPFTMSHPCNSYSAETLKILNNLGIRLGFCSNMCKKNYSLLELPREDSALLITK